MNKIVNSLNRSGHDGFMAGITLLLLLIFLNISCKKGESPVLTTASISNITGTSATSGGTISSEGSGAVISKGVCWSTSEDPTIKGNKTTDGVGAGPFTSNISGLSGVTTYYVRAYASNEYGTGYGMVLTFSTLVDKEKLENEMIQNYLNNNPTQNFQLKSSGLYYRDIVIGNGNYAQTGDTAYVKYTCKFLDGTLFDTNTDRPDSLIFPVNEGFLIAGFDEGVLYMKEGGKAIFLLPSKLAYGSEGYYTIAGYTPLLFEAEMVKLKRHN